MKLFYIFLLLIGASALGSAEDVPPELAGATTTTTTQSGKVYTFSADTEMVVNREASRLLHEKQARLVASLRAEIASLRAGSEQPTEEPKEVFNRYRLSAYLGSGPANLELQDNAEDASVVAGKDAVVGLGVGVNYDADWGVQGLLLSNETVMFGLHVNFGAK